MTELEAFHRGVHGDLAITGDSYLTCPAWPCRALREEIEAVDCECECDCDCGCLFHRTRTPS